jgi:hypothetical protein
MAVAQPLPPLADVRSGFVVQDDASGRHEHGHIHLTGGHVRHCAGLAGEVPCAGARFGAARYAYAAVRLVRRDRRIDDSPTPLAAIEDVLETCTIVPSRQAPPDVVTMYTQALLRDDGCGERSKLTLCYQAHAEPAAMAILFQPEASGDYTL